MLLAPLLIAILLSFEWLAPPLLCCTHFMNGIITSYAHKTFLKSETRGKYNTNVLCAILSDGNLLMLKTHSAFWAAARPISVDPLHLYI